MPGKSQDAPQVKDTVPRKVIYTDTVKVANRHVADLFMSSKAFVDYEMKSRGPVLRVFDEKGHKVTARGAMVYRIRTGGAPETTEISYRLTIESFEGFYVYTYNDLLLGGLPGRLGGPSLGGEFDKDDPNNISDRNWERIKESVDKVIKKQIKVLEKAMM